MSGSPDKLVFLLYMFHSVLCEEQIDSVKQGTKYTTQKPHENKDYQIDGIPKVTTNSTLIGTLERYSMIKVQINERMINIRDATRALLFLSICSANFFYRMMYSRM